MNVSSILDNNLQLLSADEMKVCNKCYELLPESSFGGHSGAKYKRPECRECNARLARELKHLHKIYGKPPKGHICPICERTEEEVKGKGGKKGSPWVLDHIHGTDIVRGWLCHSCNRGIGAFQDKIRWLKNAIIYLIKNRHGMKKP
jgi:hypothetical protein